MVLLDDNKKCTIKNFKYVVQLQRTVRHLDNRGIYKCLNSVVLHNGDWFTCSEVNILNHNIAAMKN